MSVFNEKGERALQKAYERPDVQEAMKKIVENDLPYISLILSAALEEMEKDSEVTEEAKRSDLNGE